MHGQQNDKYIETHGQQNNKYTEMNGQQNDKYNEIYGHQNDKCNEMHGQQNSKYTEMHSQQILKKAVNVVFFRNFTKWHRSRSVCVLKLTLICNFVRIGRQNFHYIYGITTIQIQLLIAV